jgi:hypothetical protein
MWVLELSDDLDLATEAVDVDAGKVRVKNLHHDPAVERALAGEKDAAHPPAAELALDGEYVAQGILKPFA